MFIIWSDLNDILPLPTNDLLILIKYSQYVLQFDNNELIYWVKIFTTDIDTN
mgnify:CR=1 FL=1